MGQLDQAGRWGLLVPGLATSAEKQAFAVWMARTQEPGEPEHDRLLRLLFVPRTFSALVIDPADAILQFEAQLQREIRRHGRASTTNLVTWFGNTLMGILGAILIGTLLGGALAATHALGIATESPLLRMSFWPKTRTELWVKTAFLTLGLIAMVIVGSMITLTVRLPGVIRYRTRQARRLKKRNERLDRVA
ncbi:hypothetical protein SZ60_07320 [Frigoribacterium sp. MEB024]|nr:hypothetical protein SZ60_07320 [Frigoribacterium sp. MEB024]